MYGQPLRWGGRKSQELRRRAIYRDGGICWICGRPGATTCDHVLPRADFPEWVWREDNLRAAHTSCNIKRGNTNASRYSRPDWLDYLDGFGIGDEHPAVRAALAGLGVELEPKPTAWATPQTTNVALEPQRYASPERHPTPTRRNPSATSSSNTYPLSVASGTKLTPDPPFPPDTPSATPPRRIYTGESRNVWTVDDAARHLDVSVQTINNWCRAGRLHWEYGHSGRSRWILGTPDQWPTRARQGRPFAI